MVTAALQRKRDSNGKFTDTTIDDNQHFYQGNVAKIFRVEKCARNQTKRSQQPTLEIGASNSVKSSLAL